MGALFTLHLPSWDKSDPLPLEETLLAAYHGNGYPSLCFCLQAFCQALGATVSLSSGFHPQTNGQMERANQDLEATLRYVTATNPSSWSTHLAWVEYAHNSLTSSATGLLPFKAALGYQPLLFPAQESELAVPSVQLHLRQCHKIWKDTRTALLHSVDNNRRIADRHQTQAPVYRPGQKVWL